MPPKNNLKRCSWCGSDPEYCHYHDNEWGIPLYDDQKLFELLLLEGAQAGLSWITILRKRENYRNAFDQFDAKKIARYSDSKKNKLLQDTGIVRNKLKINAFVKNAQAYLKLVNSGTSFSDYLWQFVNHQVIQNQPKTLADIPTTTAAAEAMSKALKKLGFSFVGPTICYAFMQAAGMVNDHTTDCYRHQELSKS